MKWFDVPPVWLLAAAVLAWVQGRHYPLGLSFGGGVWVDLLGGLLVGGGVLLMVLAVYELRRQHTTVLPHRTPSHLVQSGIYSRSRNPIYLGDVLVLAGLILRFDAVLALPLLPLLTWVIERRFILEEEDRLRRTYHTDFARYMRKVRRWV